MGQAGMAGHELRLGQEGMAEPARGLGQARLARHERRLGKEGVEQPARKISFRTPHGGTTALQHHPSGNDILHCTDRGALGT